MGWRILWASCGWPVLQAKIRENLEADEELITLDPDRSLSEQLVGVDVLVPITSEVTASLLQENPHLKAIVQPAAGFQNIDVEGARELGIPVCVSPGLNAQSTAEGTILLIMMLAKQVTEGIAAFQEGRLGHPVGMELKGKTVGIVGMGRVGSLVGEMCEGLGMRVRGVTSQSPRCDLEALLKEADVIALHCPLTQQTEGLIGQKELRMMKPKALLINMARGPVIDKIALENELEDGHLGGVGLDVHWTEPGWNPDDQVYKHKRVISLPHNACATVEVMDALAHFVVDNTHRLRVGQSLVGELSANTKTDKI